MSELERVVYEDSHTGRVAKLRQRHRDTLPQVCIERSVLMTESYKETEAFPEIIRRAKALEKILNNMTLKIDDDELIVGNAISKMRGGPTTPEINRHVVKLQMEMPANPYIDSYAEIPQAEIEKMREVCKYWEGRCNFDRLAARVPEELLAKHSIFQLPAGSACANMNLGSHMSVDWPTWLSKGFKAIKAEVDEKIASIDVIRGGDEKALNFYKAVSISLQACIDYAKRHAALARKMAAETKDPQRAKELLKIAEICDWIPENPARTFYEGLEFVWLMFTCLMVEGWGPGISFGRIDQFLYPYYKKDIEDGVLTYEQARQLLGCFFIKINQPCMRFSFETVRTAGGLLTLSDTTIGGITKDGKDASNELSYVVLDAQEDVCLFADEIIIRVNRVTSDRFLLRACETAKKLRGKFKFICDETAIQQAMYDGKPLEAARDFVVTGCALPTLPGVSWDIIGGQFNLPLMLELALNNGVHHLSGTQLGIQTGDARQFKSIEEVWDAFTKQCDYLLPIVVRVRNTDRAICAEYTPTPLQSAGYASCLERGRDVTDGGTFPYITDGISPIGAANIADSFAAMQKLVFEDKKITMDQLITALDKNFEGEDDLLKLIATAPKYGNDDDYADHWVSDTYNHLLNEIHKYKGKDGNVWDLQAYVAGGSQMLGQVAGATPDGRKGGEPIAEGGLSPYPGRNVNGVTSTINSVTKLDISKLSGGAALNLKFTPDALKDEAGLRKFASLMRTYFEQGGYHVQYNIVDSKMLKDAQVHPEDYKDLLVRVATYSAFFTDLGPECQKEVIDRIEFSEI